MTTEAPCRYPDCDCGIQGCGKPQPPEGCEDFATIAAIIRNMEKVHNQEQGFIDVREDVAEHFAAELARTNPKFDRDRFLAACR